MHKTRATLIIDSGVILAALNARDKHHQWAKDVLQNNIPPFLVCEAVLTEVAYFLRTQLTAADAKRAFTSLQAMIQIQMVVIDFEAKKHYERIFALMDEYAPSMDFADACVVVMTELTAKPKVLTVDKRDFSTYRRLGEKSIPFDAP